jgi:hypothetical protein
MPAVRNFQSGGGPVFEYPYAIVGVTRDSAGAALPFCVLEMFLTSDDTLAARGRSDASGNYRFDASSVLTHYIVAYKPGAPDVAGTTVNTLIGT